MTDLADLARSHQPFALIARAPDTVELLTGSVREVELLADIPLMDEAGGAAEVLALVPFRQVRERGFTCHDDGAPLLCLVVDEHRVIDRESALAALPNEPIPVGQGRFDIDDDGYAAIVREVIAEEIGRGEGSSFVIRRDFTASVDADPRTAALTWFRALLERERGAYWTFAVVAGDMVAVGASPEAHVRVGGGRVTMNPISGTFRHPPGGATVASLSTFLESEKETEELFMVVDEELKMMSAVCVDGGRITGPHLKEMSRLTHTEYVLQGRSSWDPRDILRETMFAPTVTGSPMQSACSVIARREHTPRGYYSGVAALFTPAPDAPDRHDMDAPILIRTAYLADGVVRVPVGATLVRHSDPRGEVSETHGKAAGLLGAIGALPADAVEDPDRPVGDAVPLASDPGIRRQLQKRNARLSAFWLEPQDGTAGPFAARTALVVDAEDRFTTMLAHQLRHLGFEARVVAWHEVDDSDAAAADLLVAGPGPGDPRDAGDPRISRMRELVNARLTTGAPLLAVCLSHQILADRLGAELAPLDAPHQGLQREVDLFGERAAIGFYNTFTARVAPGATRLGVFDVAADPRTGDVWALRGPAVASVQGHVESILSRDGMRTLERLVAHALIPAQVASEGATAAS